MDESFELAEVFLVRLLEPTDLGRLATNFTEATIEILPNQDPQGVLQIAPVGLPLEAGVLSVEENVQFVNYQVTRSFGTFGEVMVAVETTSGTATSAGGKHDLQRWEVVLAPGTVQTVCIDMKQSLILYLGGNL